jgi:uncharacterized membrane protein HdeD (DUF308 family)
MHCLMRFLFELPEFSQAAAKVVGFVVLLYGVYAVIECIRALVATERSPERYIGWWPFVSLGVADVVVGVLMVLWLRIVALELLYFTAGWSVLAGIIMVAGAIRRRKSVMGEWLLGLGGMATILLGVYLVWYPLPGLITLGWFVCTYAVVFCALGLIFVFERRRLKS